MSAGQVFSVFAQIKGQKSSDSNTLSVVLSLVAVDGNSGYAKNLATLWLLDG